MYVLAVLNLVNTAIQTGMTLANYPASISPISAGLAVFSFGVFLLVMPKE